MPDYGRFRDFLWIPLVLVFLVPVIRYTTGHSVPESATVAQGPLVAGREALDSLLAVNVGRPVIVNFWATWCTPCVGELPHIDEIYRSMEGDIAAIAVDLGDPEIETLLDFRDRFSLSLPVVWLNESDAASLKEEWGLSDILPVTVVFDSDGNEITRFAGTRDESYFRDAVSGVLPQVPDVDSQVVEQVLHINVVGFSDDSLAAELMSTAVELAGTESVDFYDPSIPSDSLKIEELYLPSSGFPYAQPCVGSACGQPVRTPEALYLAVENLSN